MVSIVIILQGIATLALAFALYRLTKDVKELGKEMWELSNNRNHISRLEQGEMERVSRENRELIELLAGELNKKVQANWSGVHMNPTSHSLVDLTTSEKLVKKLKSEIEELEEAEHAGD